MNYVQLGHHVAQFHEVQCEWSMNAPPGIGQTQDGVKQKRKTIFMTVVIEVKTTEMSFRTYTNEESSF